MNGKKAREINIIRVIVIAITVYCWWRIDGKCIILPSIWRIHSIFFSLPLILILGTCFVYVLVIYFQAFYLESMARVWLEQGITFHVYMFGGSNSCCRISRNIYIHEKCCIVCLYLYSLALCK